MKIKIKTMILLLTLTGLILPFTAAAGDRIIKGETLDIQQCVDIALKNHPSILSAAGTLKAGESRVGQARSGYYPQVSGSVVYNRISPYETSSGGRLAPNDKGAYDVTNSSIALSQNLFDFGKTAAQVRIQSLNLDSSRADFADVKSRVVFGAKQAYYELLRARRNRDVGREVVGQYEQHLARAKGFFEIGVKPKFDVTKAEVDLSNAKLSLLKAENAFRVARVTLNNALGLPEAPDFEIQDSLDLPRAEVDLDAALRKAFDRRPDLQAILVKEKALEETIAYEKKGYYPYVTGNASYGWGGDSFPLDHGWNIGATLNIPLFSGLSTKYQVDEARANLEVLKANEETLRQSIHLDVQQAWLNLREAADRIVTAEISVRQAMENLELANGRYASGVGSPIEVTDALVAESNAKTSFNAALYDYRVAQASMEKATGEK
ncbi:MAG: Outer membrane protein TolC precursor [Syntrophaceae bacterium PtaB.Bin095]|jgi:outer membrane protein TolC|nr:MAG: Outer membrane protein TolC precursor [Syntrophaceae bacterium PtaB.Bin095]